MFYEINLKAIEVNSFTVIFLGKTICGCMVNHPSNKNTDFVEKFTGGLPVVFTFLLNSRKTFHFILNDQIKPIEKLELENCTSSRPSKSQCWQTYYI